MAMIMDFILFSLKLVYNLFFDREHLEILCCKYVCNVVEK